MPGTNIKQVEAAERSALIKVSRYSIDLDLTTGAENFRVKTVVHFAGLQPGATTYIDCVGSKVISAKLNGVDFDPKFDGETIFLPAINAENVFPGTSSRNKRRTPFSGKIKQEFVVVVDDATVVSS